MNFVKIDNDTFTADGIKYRAIFIAHKLSDTTIKVVNVYDNRFVLLDNTPITDVQVDGVTYGDVATLIENLILVIQRPTGLAYLESRLLLSDADGDTKVDVEQSPDEDTIRVIVGGVERATILNNGISEFYETLRVGELSFNNPATNTTGSPALVYNEATDEVEVAQNTVVTQLPSTVTTYSDVIQYKIKNGRLIVFGFLATRPENTTTLLATLPIGARPNIERLATLYDVTSSEHQIITIKTNGELQASSMVGGRMYKIDIDITLTI